MKLSPQILAMYLGYKVQYQYSDGTTSLPLHHWLIHSVDRDGFIVISDKFKQTVHCYISENRVKPILRRLEDMTEEEAKQFLKVCGETVPTKKALKTWGWNGYRHWLRRDDEYMRDLMSINLGTPEVWSYLLSKSFDLFGLIDANEAIDAKTLQS